MAKDSDIQDSVRRIESIISQLDDQECSLSEAEQQYEEAKQKLETIRELLADDDGAVIEIE